MQQPIQKAFVTAVGKLTKPYDTAQARMHRQRAAHKRRLAHEQRGHVPYGTGKWDEARQRGYEQRAERVLECGTQPRKMGITCQCCGHKQEVDCARCNDMILCVSCRAIRSKAKAEGFLAARDVVIADAREQGRLDHARPGGRWGERMVTLTVPHLPCHSLEQRFGFLLNAWPHFLRGLNEWLRSKGIGKGTREQVDAHPGRYVHWYKVAEWVPAQDDDSGHPHFHVWVYSPWLPQELLQEWWRHSLEKVGFGDASRVLPYIERCYGDPSKELVKYIFKDIDSDGAKIPPLVMAKLYECRDRKRFAQGSRGFIQLGEADPSCPECHVSYSVVRPERRFIPGSSEMPSTDDAGA
ncbi:MAG: Replication protein [Pseudomonadota bacterium]|jgi:hypothetical protein